MAKLKKESLQMYIIIFALWIILVFPLFGFIENGKRYWVFMNIPVNFILHLLDFGLILVFPLIRYIISFLNAIFFYFLICSFVQAFKKIISCRSSRIDAGKKPERNGHRLEKNPPRDSNQ